MVTKAQALAAEDEIRTANTNHERYVRARDSGHKDYVALAKKCDLFYQGIQWNPDDVAMLGDRPSLTINEILPTVNAVMGEQSARRSDVQFKPKRGGSQDLANVLNKVFEHVAHDNKLDWIEQTVFADGLIMDGRGYFDVRMSFKKNTKGDVQIKALDPLDVLLDPDAKEQDPREWNEVITTRWNTLDDIESVYGKTKSEKLKVIAENGGDYGEDSIEWREERFGNDGNVSNAPAPTGWGKEDYRNIKRLRVIERQFYKMGRCDYFVDEMTGDQKEVPKNWNSKRATKFAEAYNLGIVSQIKKRVRWVVTCDKVVLHDDWSPYNHFTVVPYFCYFRRGKPFGMIRNLISPQEQLNKVSSQELHIVNTTANSGWVVENGSLSNMKPEQLEEKGATTGLVIEYNKGFTAPVKIQPNNVPQGLDRISAKAQQNIKTISGVNDQMLQGDAQEDVTNPMKMVQQNRGTIMAQVPLDNLKKTRHYLAEVVLDLIQNFYTEERLIQITNTNDPMNPREEIVINGMTPEGRIVNDVTQGTYDVMIASVPARDTFDDAQFLEAMAMRSIGVVIPDDAIVEYSHLARKGELAKRIRQMTGVELTEEQQAIQEMQSQLQMQAMQLEVMQLEAQIGKLQSEIAVNQAKAGNVSEQTQVTIASLQADLQKRTEELATRVELAKLAAAGRSEQAQTGAAVKIATTAMSAAARRDQQAAKAAAQGAKKPNDK